MSRKSFDRNSLIVFLVISSLAVGHSSFKLKDLLKNGGSKDDSVKKTVEVAPNPVSAGDGLKSVDKKASGDAVKSEQEKENANQIDKLAQDKDDKKQKDDDKGAKEVENDPNKPVDHAAVLKSSEAKSNKVGFVLSMIHKLSEKDAMKKRLDDKQHEKLSEKLHKMKPEDMLKELCPRSFGMCASWVARSFKRNSPLIHHIVKRIKERPQGVDPKRLLRFKMYEAAAGHVVDNGYDDIADSAINMVAKKSPYLTLPITAVDLTLSTIYAT